MSTPVVEASAEHGARADWPERSGTRQPHDSEAILEATLPRYGDGVAGQASPMLAGAFGLVVLAAAAVLLLPSSIGPFGSFIASVGWGADQAVALGLVGLAVIFFVLDRLYGPAYEATLWVLAPLVPLVGAVATMAAALQPTAGALVPAAATKVDPLAIRTGTLVALAVWVVGSAALRGMASVNTAQVRSYGELCSRAHQLRDRYATLARAYNEHGLWHNGTVVEKRVEIETALTEAKAQLEIAYEELSRTNDQSSGLRWATASGYVGVSRALHRAEEALLDVLPESMLYGEALHDYVSLQGSRVPKAKALINRLQGAMVLLSPDVAERFFDWNPPPVPGQTVPPGNGGVLVKPANGMLADASANGASPDSSADGRGGSATGGTSPSAAAAGASPAAATGTTAPVAPASASSTVTGVSAVQPAGLGPVRDVAALNAVRGVLREIRFVLNDFRDDRADGLVRARNRLWRTILVAAVSTFLLLGLAVANEVQKVTLFAAGAFFLVGAVSGLLNKLRIEGRNSSAVDDFGLFEARLIHTPVLSGIAALAGVFLTAFASIQAQPTLPDLGKVYDLAQNPMGLVVAAAFGLAPATLFQRLQAEADGFKKDISSSEPSENASGAPDEEAPST